MFKKLPQKRSLWLMVLGLLLIIFTIYHLPFTINTTYAQTAAPSSAPVGTWQSDADVTFAGKIGNRSADLLDWVIKNYQWANVNDLGVTNQPSNTLRTVYAKVQFIVFALLAMFILVGAILMIISRGQSLTVKRFALRFMITVALVFLSFAIIDFIYLIFDVVQGFFFKIDGNIISSRDLLSIGFGYNNFQGLRLAGAEFDESAFMSTLLVKVTAATYFTMFGVLIVRKVILWFFLIVAPIFPLLLMFSPLRNSAKLWVGEFFRWVLYGPLFSIFLFGLVILWRSGVGMPINLNVPCDDATKAQTLVTQGAQNNTSVYPTAINILLGGPCEDIRLRVEGAWVNNLTTPDSFIQYIIALIMLWMVIIMPFLLLKIFLDYLKNTALGGDNNWIKYITAAGRQGLERTGLRPRQPKPGPTPGLPAPAGTTGLAKELPFFKESPMEAMQKNMQEIANQNSALSQTAITNMNTANQSANQSMNQSISEANRSSVNALQNYSTDFAAQNSNITVGQADIQVMSLANLSIPTMADIAKYETSLLGQDTHSKEETNRVYEILNRIGGTSTITSQSEQGKYERLRTQLQVQAQTGSLVASNILDASKKKADLPAVNRTQKVNVEDYEKVKRTWKENFKKLQTPGKADGTKMGRKEYIQQEIERIQLAINLISSNDPIKVKQGMEMVGKILPFLLLGGFSKQEVIVYLKAKLEAAKETLAELQQVKEDEDTMVSVDRDQTEKPKTMTLEAQVPEEKKTLS